MIHFAVLLLVGSGVVTAEQPTAAGVKAVGVYPLLLPGLQAVPAGRPTVRLWCRGTKLLGVMVPDESQPKVVPAAAQGRTLPSAVLLRDGRCEADGGGVSFGFLVPMRAWIFDTSRAAPGERTTWLLHRFQGTVSDRQLKGVLVQVDISHPGLAFREAKVEVEGLGDEQASFADEKGWLEEIGKTLILVRAEP